MYKRQPQPSVWLCLLLLVIALVWFGKIDGQASCCCDSVPSSTPTMTSRRAIIGFLPRGGSDSGDHTHSEYDPQFQQRTKISQQYRKGKHGSQNILTTMAQKSIQLGTGLVTETAQQSKQMAYYLIQPKHVKAQELIGLWRLDEQCSSSSSSRWNNNIPSTIDCTTTTTIHRLDIHLRRVSAVEEEEEKKTEKKKKEDNLTLLYGTLTQSEVRGGSSGTIAHENIRIQYTPAHWPRHAIIEFRIPVIHPSSSSMVHQKKKKGIYWNHPQRQQQEWYVYRATIHRKLLAQHVLKLRGKVYHTKLTWRGTERTTCIGTFVGRKRMQKKLENANLKESLLQDVSNTDDIDCDESKDDDDIEGEDVIEDDDDDDLTEEYDDDDQIDEDDDDQIEENYDDIEEEYYDIVDDAEADD